MLSPRPAQPARPLHQLVFEDAIVDVWADCIVTRFRNGDTLPAAPQYDHAYRATAYRLGFGEDVDAMNRSHDPAHLYLAQLLSHGRVQSPTLQAEAARRTRGEAAAPHVPAWVMAGEEALVLDFQRYCQTGEPAPSLACLVLAGYALEDVRERLQTLMEKVTT